MTENITWYIKISTNIWEFTTALTKEELLSKKKEALKNWEMLEIETFITEGPFLWKLCTFKHKVSLDLNHVAILSIEEISEAVEKESNYDKLKRENPELFADAEKEAWEKLLNGLIEAKARVMISDFENAFEQGNKDLIFKLALPEALRILKEKVEPKETEEVKNESE